MLSGGDGSVGDGRENGSGDAVSFGMESGDGLKIFARDGVVE